MRANSRWRYHTAQPAEQTEPDMTTYDTVVLGPSFALRLLARSRRGRSSEGKARVPYVPAGADTSGMAALGREGRHLADKAELEGTEGELVLGAFFR